MAFVKDRAPHSGAKVKMKFISSPIEQSKRTLFSSPLSLRFKRVKGVEPSSQPWQGCIIAAIRHPHFVPGVRLALTTPAFSELCSNYLSYPGILYVDDAGLEPAISSACPVKIFRGRYRTRTYDPLSVNEMLYQLS